MGDESLRGAHAGRRCKAASSLVQRVLFVSAYGPFWDKSRLHGGFRIDARGDGIWPNGYRAGGICSSRRLRIEASIASSS